jgi:phospholipase A1
MASQVVILIPGTMGSVLQLDGRVIWPGSVLRIFGPYPRLDDLLNPRATAVDVLRRIFIFKQYAALIHDLAGMGYPERRAADPGHRLVVFPYDWRKSSVDAAASLSTLITTIATSTPDAEVTLLGHGMGGLVARYYVESGSFSAAQGFDRVKAVVLMAAPSGGAIAALETILGLRGMPFLSRAQSRQFSNDARYPAAYHSLPGPGTPFLWSDAPGESVRSLDLYDPQIVSALGLSTASLASVVGFRQGLSLENKPPTVRYFSFVGTHARTSTACYLSGSTIRSVRARCAGDGAVPVWSSHLPDVQQIQVGGSHASLYRDGTLLQYLARLLRLEAAPAGAPASASASASARTNPSPPQFAVEQP